MVTTKKIILDPYKDILKQILAEVVDLRQKIETKANQRLQKYTGKFKSGYFSDSAGNLAHYLAMRQFDLRHLQDRLAQAGLSSLGRAEASVLSTMDSLIDILKRATEKHYLPDEKKTSKYGFNLGRQLLKQHTIDLFGPSPEQGRAHVMVTLPTEASLDYLLVSSLLEKGMTCARINCAHDDPVIWEGMIKNIRRAEIETRCSCRILMDLAGHKIRTGPVELGPSIHHIRVQKDLTGKVVAPGYLILTSNPESRSIDSTLFRVPIPKLLHNELVPGMHLGFMSNQDKSRYLKVEKALSETDWLVSCDKTAYLVPGCAVTLTTKHQSDNQTSDNQFTLGEFTGEPLDIRVFKNQLLLLTNGNINGKPAEQDENILIHPAQIGCTLSSLIEKLKVGQSVWIDDGKLGAVVEAVTEQGALLRVTVAKAGGVRIQSDKGINFPEAEFNLPALTQKDLIDLDFICVHADLVGFSFVETLADMECLMSELTKRKASKLPIIAKIETNRAVKNLPDIILGTIGRHNLGIMIARGDLAVELGSARLAEIQEEILWLCEAAHVPVIWATQVLESITKKGTRSRPEFTDAAMAVRAECVMLNKGPYILDAIGALVSVMVRMHEHQRKKFSRLRALHW
ncbi:pyruvate kinase [Methylobacter sp. S3L5C]|uniref:pyruvate kinase n=1 Tax=Methylobacter sp. S3L5C TaxID=2839024 RepID=UPI001FABFCA9|nr:pyruvate kinase [Methylobacter sp. S3L5C]UOA10309.1 pyruvate kinase [Methylobacter sp. S3L5C]